MANTVDKVIAIAEAEVGYLEKSKSAYLKDKSVLDRKTDGAGSDNYTKYGRDMHELYPQVMDFPAYWCDCFVDWCFQKAYGVSNAKKLLGGNFDDYTVNSAQLYKNKNAYYSTPKVGDQIFFRNNQRICHTGLVVKVTSTTVYTIEGNTSGASGVVSNGGGVARKSYPFGYTSSSGYRIDGYGRPKYDVVTNESTSNNSNAKKSNEEIVKEVLAGKWGNGVDRKNRLTAAGYDYNAIQSIINAGNKGTTTTPSITYFKKYTGTSGSIVVALKAIGAESSYAYRKTIATKNNISGYSGTANQNTKMVNLLKQGKLIKP